MVSIYAYCSGCGEEIEAMFSYDDENLGVHLAVHPCKTCLKAAKDAGDSEGFERAVAASRIEFYADGISCEEHDNEMREMERDARAAVAEAAYEARCQAQEEQR